MLYIDELLLQYSYALHLDIQSYQFLKPLNHFISQFKIEKIKLMVAIISPNLKIENTT